MTREFLGLAGWGVAVLAARLFQPLLTGRIEDIVGNESATAVLSFAIPFVIVVIVWFFFANIVAPGLKKSLLAIWTTARLHLWPCARFCSDRICLYGRADGV